MTSCFVTGIGLLSKCPRSGMISSAADRVAFLADRLKLELLAYSLKAFVIYRLVELMGNCGRMIGHSRGVPSFERV